MTDTLFSIVKRDDGTYFAGWETIAKHVPKWTPESTQARAFAVRDEASDEAFRLITNHGVTVEVVDVVNEVDALAERLVAAGDEDSFREVFGTGNLDFDVRSMSASDLLYVYGEYVNEDEPPTDDE